jgi:chemotaxis protein methyltransferase CheR
MDFRDPRTVQNATATLMRDLIHDRTGIFFGESNMGILIDKISSLMAERGCDSLVDYYYRLKYDNDAMEWASLLDAISVRETFFWREFDQIRALIDVLMPRLVHAGREPIRIWSAACASGEEPLTIAMALDLAGWFDRVQIEIHASDASEAALRVAKTGIYRERSFRALPIEHRSRFFVPIENSWKIKTFVHDRICWHRVNLANPLELEKLAQVPVIFCRNVFIYFSEATILKTVKMMERQMCTPGYLFLGAAESLLRFDVELDLQEIGGAFVYVKN